MKKINKVQKRVDALKRKVNADFTDIDWLKTETDDIVEEYMRNGGIRPVKELPNELELMAMLLAKTHENIERLTITERSREEWEELERKTVPPIPLDIPEGYKVCGCWNCNRLFKRKGKTKYCSDECTQEQMDANKRFKQTGTYLAPYRDDYRPKRDETAERMRKLKEVHIV
jgi:hypothetical protein